MERECSIMSFDYDKLKRKGFLKQRQEGQFLIRFRSIAGNLSSDDLRAMADLADQYGKGYVHLTTRLGVEIPWITKENCEPVSEKIEQYALNTGASGKRIRTVVACPGSQVCRYGIVDTTEMAAKLDREFFGKDVPTKTKIAVSGCPNSCAKPQENDIGLSGVIDPVLSEESCSGCGLCEESCPNHAIEIESGLPKIEELKCLNCGRCIEACPTGAWQEGPRGFKLYVGGKVGRKPKLGQVLINHLEEEEVVGTIQKVLAAFADLAQKGERIADVVERVGLTEFKKHVDNLV
jgi:anaerobic sulfite reductase subunit C